MSPEIVIAAASLVCIGLVLLVVRLTCPSAEPLPIPVTTEYIELAGSAANRLRSLADAERSQLLQRLETDFSLICSSIKVVLIHSNVDRPDLARFLIRSWITFTFRLTVLRCKVAWLRFGLGRSTSRA